jgi:cobalamin biosynthesis protein CobT
VNHYLVKSFDARWRVAEDMLAGLFFMAAAPQEAARAARRDADLAPPISMFDKAANVDEFNVAYAAQRLSGRRVQTRIMVVLADGMTRGSVQALADAVDAVEQTGAVVLGIGIGDETVQAAYSRNQVVERPDELAGAMVDGVRSTLYRTIARMGGDTWWAHSSEQVLYDQPTPRRTNA